MNKQPPPLMFWDIEADAEIPGYFKISSRKPMEGLSFTLVCKGAEPSAKLVYFLEYLFRRSILHDLSERVLDKIKPPCLSDNETPEILDLLRELIKYRAIEEELLPTSQPPSTNGDKDVLH